MNLVYPSPQFKPFFNNQIIICNRQSQHRFLQNELIQFFNPNQISMNNNVDYSSDDSIANVGDNLSNNDQQKKVCVHYYIINNNYYLKNPNYLAIKNRMSDKNKIFEQKNMSDKDQRDEFINLNNNNYEINGNNTNNDEFLNSIRFFIRNLEMGEGQQSISSNSYGISRRRLYDIVNIFESIGCCKKSQHESVIWIGKSNIKNKFESIIQSKNLYNYETSLVDLFPEDECVGIANLTTSLVLLFYALKTDKLDLRYASHFLARKPTRLKTTLNKVYQIAHIMSAVDLMKKTSEIGIVYISNELINIDIISSKIEKASKFGTIQSFLNNDANYELESIRKRRSDFNKFFDEYKNK